MKNFQKKARLIILLLVSTLVLISCMPQTPTEVTEEPEEPTGTVVTMEGLTYQPAEITVSAGTTVTWTNEDNVGHTVTAGTRESPTGLFDQNVPAGDSFSYTFEETGTYDYYCSIHPGMNGTVIVE